MKEEQLMMSLKDRDRLKVLHGLERGKLSQQAGAAELGLSTRQLRRLQTRYRAEGDRGIIHRSRGQSSPHRLPKRLVSRIVAELKERYADFGATLASEALAKAGLKVSRETVRQLQIEHGLHRARHRQPVHRQRRERRACFGELVQMDTSQHDWLEGRGEPLVLITMIDDATSRMRGQFFRQDTSLTNLTQLRAWVEEFGRPVALYVDRASHFKVNVERLRSQGDPEAHAFQTQIERALQELQIELIWAYSPQAKGRIERSYGTLQDRLVKQMRLARVSSLAAANEFLAQEFLPEWERRWTVPARQCWDAHRRAQRGLDLDAIFSVRQTRTVKNDHTIQWQRRVFQLLPLKPLRDLRHRRVELEQRLDGTLALRFQDQYLAFREVGQPMPPPQAPAEILAPVRAYAKPAPDHPWRRKAFRHAGSAHTPSVKTSVTECVRKHAPDDPCRPDGAPSW